MLITSATSKIKFMSTTTVPHVTSAKCVENSGELSLLSKFVKWCEGQQKYRLLWSGISLAALGSMFTPLTVFVVMHFGNPLPLFVLAIAAMGMTLVTNLAALPTKITIPLFICSILIDLAIIITCMVLHA